MIEFTPKQFQFTKLCGPLHFEYWDCCSQLLEMWPVSQMSQAKAYKINVFWMVSGKKYDQKVNLGLQCILCRPLTVSTYPPPVQKRNLQFNSREGQNLKKLEISRCTQKLWLYPKTPWVGFRTWKQCLFMLWSFVHFSHPVAWRKKKSLLHFQNFPKRLGLYLSIFGCILKFSILVNFNHP